MTSQQLLLSLFVLMCPFSSCFQELFSLSLVFSSWLWCAWVWFSLYLSCLGDWVSSSIYKLISLPNFGIFLAVISSNFFFCCFFSFYDSSYMCIRLLHGVQQTVFFSIFFCSLVWVISLDLSSVLSFSILLLSPFSKFSVLESEIFSCRIYIQLFLQFLFFCWNFQSCRLSYLH